MIPWLISAWGQIWPNLAASAIATGAGFAWHHRHLKRLLAAHRDDIKQHLDRG